MLFLRIGRASRSTSHVHTFRIRLPHRISSKASRHVHTTSHCSAQTRNSTRTDQEALSRRREASIALAAALRNPEFTEIEHESKRESVKASRAIQSEEEVQSQEIEPEEESNSGKDANSQVGPQTEDSPPPAPFALRPYQESAISACVQALEEGILRMGVSSPTGSGKTTMFMRLIPEIVEREGIRKKTLILVSALELADQAAQAAKRLLHGQWSLEIEQGRRKATGFADVTIATYQTLARAGRLDKYDPSEYGLIIVDEAHHAAAKSYLRILQHFNQDVSLPSDLEPTISLDHGNRVPIVGFSATFSRPDQIALVAVFERIVFHREIATMLNEGWLSPAKLTNVEANIDLSGVKMTRGDFNLSELSDKMDQPETNQLIVRTYIHMARHRRSTLVFCVDLSHVESLTAAFRKAGIDARFVTSLSKNTERRETLAAFLNGEFPVLINCEVLTEGADIPTIDCIILARPCRSRNLLAQMVGRGLRLSPSTGKVDCHIIDIVDSTSRGLTVSPTLLGLSYDSLETIGDENRDEKETREDTTGPGTEPHSSPDDKRYKVRFLDVEDPFGLQAGSTRNLSVHSMTRYAWVLCRKDRFAINLISAERGSYLKIEAAKTESGEKIWQITRHDAAPPYWQGSRFQRQVSFVGSAEDLERAFATADAYLVNKFGYEGAALHLRDASWRQQPATKKQIDMLCSRPHVEVMPAQNGQPKSLKIGSKVMAVSSITKGSIDSVLLALKRGAITQRRDNEERAQKVIERQRQKKLKESGGLELPPET